MAVLSSVTVNAMSPSPSVPLASEMPTVGVTAAGGPATVAEGLFESGRGFSPRVHTAPVVPQSRFPGSVIETSPWPSGLTVISHRSLRPLTRRAPVTSPPVTVKPSSRSTA